MSEQLEKAINDVKSRIGSKERELVELRGRLRELQAEVARLKYGITIGTLVTWHGKVYRVVVVYADGSAASLATPGGSVFGKPWVDGVLRRKDGTFGEAPWHLYSDWELVEPVTRAAE